MHRTRNLFGMLVAFFLLSATGAQGQTSRGSISGNVYDASAAAIPGATVTVTQKETGLRRTLSTATSGDFLFPDLAAGFYAVTASHAGFQTQQIENVEVQVARTTNLPITLSVAQQMQTVEVTAAAAALETTQTALNAVVTRRAVQDVPLNGRDYRQLLTLTPGFVSAAGAFESQNGNRYNQNNWQLDGVDNNDLWHNTEAINQGSISGVAGVLLPIDAIEEFNQQSVGGADFGRNPGSMVNVVIKGGTNDLHGSAYYFHRNEAVASTSPFTSPGTPSELRNHNFGASLGGPIVRNKAFLFLSYEGQRFISGNAIVATVPSNAWVTQSSAVLAKYSVPVNPVMTNVLANLWPSSIRNAPGTSLNFVSGDNNNYLSNNFVGKIDYNFNDKNRFFIRSIIATGDATAYAGSVYRDYFQAVPSRQQNWAAVLTSSLTPRFVNQVLVGVNYFLQNFNDLNNGANPPALGFNTGVTSFNFGTPNMEIDGFPNGGVGETPNLGRTDTTWHVTDDVSYALGSHALKFGGEYRHAKLFVHYLRDARGDFLWEGTAGPWAKDPSFSEPQRALADFLAGFISAGDATIATGDPRRNWLVNTISGYAQDNWQRSPRLNLSFGVRYDYNSPYHDPTHTIGIYLPNAPGGLAFPGQTGSPIGSIFPPDHHEFAPRLGFAFSPRRGGKTVIRGAWGIYYDTPNGNLFIDNRGSRDSGRGTSRNPGGPSPVFTITNNSLLTVVKDQPVFGSVTPQPPFGAYTINQNLTAPYVQNFSLNVQRQLSPSAVLQVGYVGSQARKLLITRNENQPPPSPTSYTSSGFTAARPFGLAFPQFAGITELSSSADSHYNSLQVSLRNTTWRGLTGQMAYTFSHARDEISFPRNRWPADSNNVRGDWGNADSDIRHILGGYFLYDVPQLGHSLPRLTKGWQLNTFFTFESGFPFTVFAGGNNSNTRARKDRADQVGNPFSGIVQPAQSGGLLTNGVTWFNPAAFKKNARGTFGNTARNAFYGPPFKSVDFSIFKNTPITERLSTQFRVEIFNVFNILNLASPDNFVSDGASFGLVTSTLATANGAPGIGSGEPFNIQFALKLRW